MPTINIQDPQTCVLADSYWYYADPLLLIKDTDPTDSWMLNTYVNIIALDAVDPHPEGDIYNVSIHFDFMLRYRNFLMSFYDCPFLDFYKVDKDRQGNIYGINILDYIKLKIRSGFSVLLMVNRRYLSGYKDYDKGHQILIYGYDEQAECLIYSDNAVTGKYRINLKCSYGSFQQAYQQSHTSYQRDEEFNRSVFLLKAIPSEEYKINIPLIKQKLYQYINQTPLPLDDQRYSYFNGIPISYGAGIYDLYLKRIRQFIENEIKLTFDIRDFASLYDHKKIMLYRIHKLIEYGYLSSNELYEAYQSVTEKSEVLLNLAVKYNVNPDRKIVRQIMDIFESLIEEPTILNSVYQQL